MKHNFSNIFQDHLPISPWHELHLKGLPGINPLDRKDWILVDNVFDGQMAYADYLLSNKLNSVLLIDIYADDAARELLAHVLKALIAIKGYLINANTVKRPDSVIVKIDWNQALKTARSLVQQDLCIMLPIEDEYILVGAAMCFPASWTLSEKFMRPMTSIHEPVEEYSADLAKRVDRIFKLMRPDQDMWRANWLVYDDPDLHQPRKRNEVRPRIVSKEQWVRVERQSFCKLPNTQAIIFGIHTCVLPFLELTDIQKITLNAVTQ